MENENKPYDVRYSIAALILDVASPVSFCLGAWLIRFNFMGLFLFLIAVIAPVVAVGMGIASLCMGKKKIGTAGVVMSSVAIAVPVIFVITVVLLFSTGVAVIRWM